jgi:hypothetical protein
MQPAEEVELHPASVVDACAAAPRLGKVRAELGYCVCGEPGERRMHLGNRLRIAFSSNCVQRGETVRTSDTLS